MTPPAIALNIDTSRLSQFVENLERNDCVDLFRELTRGDCYLVVCLTRVMELSRIEPARRANIISLLREVPTLIGQPEEVLEQDELKSACAALSRLERRPPKPFARDTADWGYALNTLGGSAADLLAIADPSMEEFADLRRIADEHVETARQLRTNAAVVRDRPVHLRHALHSHLADHRRRTSQYGGTLSADQIISHAGGLRAFPTFEVKAELLAARLNHRSPAESNDVFDEDIARYHPYSAVSVLDNATVKRFWAARIPGRERVVAKLTDALEVIRRVRAGELAVHDFYLPERTSAA